MYLQSTHFYAQRHHRMNRMYAMAQQQNYNSDESIFDSRYIIRRGAINKNKGIYYCQ